MSSRMSTERNSESADINISNVVFNIADELIQYCHTYLTMGQSKIAKKDKSVISQLEHIATEIKTLDNAFFANTLLYEFLAALLKEEQKRSIRRKSPSNLNDIYQLVIAQLIKINKVLISPNATPDTLAEMYLGSWVISVVTASPEYARKQFLSSICLGMPNSTYNCQQAPLEKQKIIFQDFIDVAARSCHIDEEKITNDWERNTIYGKSIGSPEWIGFTDKTNGILAIKQFFSAQHIHQLKDQQFLMRFLTQHGFLGFCMNWTSYVSQAFNYSPVFDQQKKYAYFIHNPSNHCLDLYYVVWIKCFSMDKHIAQLKNPIPLVMYCGYRLNMHEPTSALYNAQCYLLASCTEHADSGIQSLDGLKAIWPICL